MRLPVLSVLLVTTGLVQPCFAQAKVTLRAGFASTLAQVARSPDSALGTKALGWDPVDKGYGTKTPTIAIEVPERISVAWRISSTGGAVSATYLAYITRSKLWSIELKSGAQSSNPNQKLYRSGWQVMVLEPGSYQIHHIHSYPNQATSDVRLELVELSPHAQTLSPGFSEQQAHLTNLRGAPWARAPSIDLGAGTIKNVAVTSGPCAGSFRSQLPITTLTIAQPLAATSLELSRGQGAGLFVVDASGQEHCTAASSTGRDGKPKGVVMLNAVPAGKLAVYLLAPTAQHGSRPAHPNGDAFYDVTLEDLSKPRAMPWAEGAPRWVVDGAVAAPLVAQVSTQGRGAVREVCGSEGGLVTQPLGPLPGGVRADAVLDVRRPQEGLFLRERSLGQAVVEVRGPYGADGREVDADYQARCFAIPGTAQQRLPRLEPGLYAVRVGLSGGTSGSTLILHDAQSKLEPLRRTAEPTAASTLAQRLLTLYYGQLPGAKECVGGGGCAKQHYTDLDPALRQALFLDAPLGLFVYPTVDLDAQSAIVAQNEGAGTAAIEQPSLPRKNEPLLLLGIEPQQAFVNVLTADGSVFAVQQRYLGLTAAGAVQLPTDARNLGLRWEDAALISTPDEQVKVQSLERKSEKANECVSRKLDGKRAKYHVLTLTQGGSTYERSVHSAADLEAAERACGVAPLKQTQKSLLADIEKSFRARIKLSLQKIAARFSTGQ